MQKSLLEIRAFSVRENRPFEEVRPCNLHLSLVYDPSSDQTLRRRMAQQTSVQIRRGQCHELERQTRSRFAVTTPSSFVQTVPTLKELSAISPS
jgi:hypothetical protein